MKLTRSILSLIITLIIAVGLFTMSAHAATANAAVSVSSSSVKPGASFTVTVRVSSSAKLGSVEGIMNYDAAKVEFVSGDNVSGSNGKLTFSQWSTVGGVNEFKFTLSFKAKAEGTATFSFESTEISEDNYSLVGNVSASAKVSVVADKPLSSNNYLKSLKLSSGTLSPAFSKNVLNYTVNVPNETKTMYLNPTVEDSTAEYAVSGSANLKVGTNTRKVTVTAQNGDKRVYTITINRAAAEGEPTPSVPPVSSQPPSVSEEPSQDVTVFIDGVKMTVVEDLTSVQIPEGFTATVTTLGDREVMAMTDSTGKLTMLCLADEEGNNRIFIYNSADISYYPFTPISVNGQSFIPVNKPETVAVPEGFTPTELTVGDKVYQAWVCDEQPEFYLMYLFNAKGESIYYVYDSIEGTLQRYIGIAADGISSGSSNPSSTKPIIERYDSMFGKIGIYAVILLAVAVIVLSVLLTVILSKGNTKAKESAKPDNSNNSVSFDDDFVLPKD